MEKRGWKQHLNLAKEIICYLWARVMICQMLQNHWLLSQMESEWV